MASLFRPKVVTYQLPDGSHRTPDGRRVTKQTPGAVRTVQRSKKWYGRYANAAGKIERVPLSESKEIAGRMLKKLVGDVELARVGIVNPYGQHQRRPLAEHAEDFRRYLAAKGNTAHYVGKDHARVVAVIEGCRFKWTTDLQASAVAEFLATLRVYDHEVPELDPAREWYSVADAAALLGIDSESLRHQLHRGPLPGPAPDRPKGQAQRLHRTLVEGLLARRTQGLGPRTVNDYLGAIKRFSKWLVKDKRAAVDPLAHMERLNAKVEPRHPRRALREEVFHRLIEATAAGRTFRGLTGPDRLVLYTLGANTGFRASELASLTPASFSLCKGDLFNAVTPTVTVKACHSKHRREDIQPLRPDVAEMMRQYIEGKPRHQPLWPGKWKRDGAHILRTDLQAAGIDYADDEGRVFDFHAIRGQFISFLAATGVHPKVAQVLARHSTITLTMDYYTRHDVLDVAGALDKLPPLKLHTGQEQPEPQRRPA